MKNEKFLRNFDWNLLMIFLVITEEKNLTEAAKRLNITQPSISNALKRLETSVGHRLIERRKGYFSITNQGCLFREQALQAAQSLNEIGNLVASKNGLSGEISINLASHFESKALDATLREFHQTHPDVTFYIETVPSERIISEIQKGTLLFGFCVLAEAISSLECLELGTSEMSFYCGKNHPLFGRNDITLQDLQEQRYISFESDHLEGGLNEVALLGIGKLFRAKRVAVSPNDEEVLRLIKTGIGFGPLFPAMAQPHVDAGILWQLPPYDHAPQIKNFLVMNMSRELTAAEAYFIDLLNSIFHKLKSDIW